MSSAILTQLVSPGFRASVYLGNALWHTSAAVHFGLRPEYMMHKLSTRKLDVKTIETPEGDAWHHDIMRYLGGINVGYAVLATLRFIPLLGVVRSKGRNAVSASLADKEVQAYVDVVTLTALGLANLSQALCNTFIAKPSNRWIMGQWKGLETDRITVLDTLFAVLDFAIVGARIVGY